MMLLAEIDDVDDIGALGEHRLARLKAAIADGRVRAKLTLETIDSA